MEEKPKTQDTIQPHLECGLMIDRPSMLVDQSGNAWWVNPETCQIRRATAKDLVVDKQQ